MAESERTRNWVAVCYTENSVERFWENLDSVGAIYVLSPLHNQDLNPTGEPKKEHYHLLLIFDGPKSEKQITNLIKACGGNCAKPLPALSIRGSVRYWTHADNPEKAQYSESDMIYHGITRSQCDSISEIETDSMITDMICFIHSHYIRSYSGFVRWCSKNDYDWYRLLLHTCTYVIKEVITSFRYDLAEFEHGKFIGVPYWLEDSNEKQG